MKISTRTNRWRSGNGLYGHLRPFKAGVEITETACTAYGPGYDEIGQAISTTKVLIDLFTGAPNFVQYRITLSMDEAARLLKQLAPLAPYEPKG